MSTECYPENQNKAVSSNFSLFPCYLVPNKKQRIYKGTVCGFSPKIYNKSIHIINLFISHLLHILPGANEKIRIYKRTKCKAVNYNIYELLPIYFLVGVETEIIEKEFTYSNYLTPWYCIRMATCKFTVFVLFPTDLSRAGM